MKQWQKKEEMARYAKKTPISFHRKRLQLPTFESSYHKALDMKSESQIY